MKSQSEQQGIDSAHSLRKVENLSIWMAHSTTEANITFNYNHYSSNSIERGVTPAES